MKTATVTATVTATATAMALSCLLWPRAQSLYNPEQNLCVDESMLKHKGHSDHVAYMPAKPGRWGLKVWVLAESVTGKCMPFHFLFQVPLPHPDMLSGSASQKSKSGPKTKLRLQQVQHGVYTCQHSHLCVMSKTSVPIPQ